MSGQERDRLKIVHEWDKGLLGQKEAAGLMRVSVRQARRICKRYLAEGDAGVVHRLRGRPSARKIPGKVRKKVLRCIEKRYRGFGPTLASEYLESEAGISVSRETLRGWMMEVGLWQRNKKRAKHRRWRERKACFGEMVQMDTSEHDWFEGRGEKAFLITMIDDATSRVWMHFVSTDSTKTNMGVLRDYLRRHGRPLAIYADRASHFKTTREPSREETLAGRAAETQIERALRELDIQYVPAYSPQAKGRVERSFATAQDRLIKGMRLEGICTIVQANRYLSRVFIPMWNRRFTVRPASPVDVHRPIKGYDLGVILSTQTERAVNNDYTIRHQGRWYQIERKEAVGGLRKSRVLMEERLDGKLKIRWRGRYLKFKRIRKHEEEDQRRAGAVTPVGLRPPSVTALTKQKRPSSNHPWKRTFLLCRKQDISTLR